MNFVKWFPMFCLASLGFANNETLLRGSYTLDEFQIVSRDMKERPFCKKATGVIIYEKSGYMSVAINCPPAENFGPSEPADRYGRMLFYTGKYRLNNLGDTIVHTITNTSYAPILGKDIDRKIADISEKSLELTGDFGEDTLRITWDRVIPKPR